MAFLFTFTFVREKNAVYFEKFEKKSYVQNGASLCLAKSYQTLNKRSSHKYSATTLSLY
jgi:hypothetical protein